MCKIFTILNNTNSPNSKYLEEQIRTVFIKLKHVDIHADMAFNDSYEENEQPIEDDNIILLCNGEIYNSIELYRWMNIQPKTNYSCEVVLHLYKNYGIEQTLQMIDGVFSFVLFDKRLVSGNSKIYVASDSYGLRPLYVLCPKKGGSASSPTPIFCLSTEKKVLNNICHLLNEPEENEKSVNETLHDCLSFYKRNIKYKKEYLLNYEVKKITPGSYYYFKLPEKVCSVWNIEKESVYYNTLSGYSKNIFSDIDLLLTNFQSNIIQAVEKRCDYVKNRAACIITGDYESSLIAILVSENYKKNGYGQLKTFSIGFGEKEEQATIRMLAYYLDIDHTEIIITEKEIGLAIPELIEILGSKDVDLICENISYYLISKHIKEHNNNIRYIFTCIGADEVFGKKINAIDEIEFDMKCRQNLKDIHHNTVLHSFNMFFENGLILENSFLDRNFIQYYFSLSPEYRFPNDRYDDMIYDRLLKETIDNGTYKGLDRTQLLPSSITTQISNENDELINKYVKKYFC